MFNCIFLEFLSSYLNVTLKIVNSKFCWSVPSIARKVKSKITRHALTMEAHFLQPKFIIFEPKDAIKMQCQAFSFHTKYSILLKQIENTYKRWIAVWMSTNCTKIEVLLENDSKVLYILLNDYNFHKLMSYLRVKTPQFFPLIIA